MVDGVKDHVKSHVILTFKGLAIQVDPIFFGFSGGGLSVHERIGVILAS